MLTSVAAVRQHLQANKIDFGTETVSLSEAQGRSLRQNLVADRDQPPFDRVAMDGITIDYAAYAAGQRLFPIAGLQAAGTLPIPLTNPASCLEIMTGAALPPGATTIIRYEDLKREGVAFRLPDGILDGANLHRRGKDVMAGAVLAEIGQYIGVGEIGMLATCGYDQVAVARL
ncbi:MAG: molybdopterin molybdenumtransferase MoeA, partial [Bacteroidota bacterium]